VRLIQLFSFNPYFRQLVVCLHAFFHAGEGIRPSLINESFKNFMHLVQLCYECTVTIESSYNLSLNVFKPQNDIVSAKSIILPEETIMWLEYAFNQFDVVFRV
jgi:hypothetical protein